MLAHLAPTQLAGEMHSIIQTRGAQYRPHALREPRIFGTAQKPLAAGHSGAYVAPGLREVLHALAPVVSAQGNYHRCIGRNAVFRSDLLSKLGTVCVDLVHQLDRRRELNGQNRDSRRFGPFAEEDTLQGGAERPHYIDAPHRVAYQPAHHRRASLSVSVLRTIQNVAPDVVHDEANAQQTQPLQKSGGDGIGESIAADDGVRPEAPNGGADHPHTVHQVAPVEALSEDSIGNPG